MAVVDRLGMDAHVYGYDEALLLAEFFLQELPEGLSNT